jgi:ribosomal 50S subunit-recycling heat shock protein
LPQAIGSIKLPERQINGSSYTKSAHSVKVGDRITLKRRDSQTEFRVLRAPETRNVAKRDAPELVELISRKEFEPWD